ncbi:MAG: efflux RND transporter periplasmic adaptor subunit [Gammaproteobacteria bacterium]|nr:efflux RND transporter periplasmic adaptor subunit [Gammaproteobacteria bacterium]
MNIVTRNLALLFVLASSFMLLACSSESEPGSASNGQETFQEHATKHLDPTYVCPMHPEVTSDQPGNCPICGMELVPRSQQEMSSEGEREILYYRHPHDPEIISETPAQDAMGMDFIPVHAGGNGSVRVSAGMVQNLGVRTAKVERDKLWRRIDTVGHIDYNEALLRHIHPRVAGWIQELAVRSEGERVQQGDVLFRFYSPDLVNAQEEFITSLASGNRRLQRFSRERLLAMDVSKRDIDRIAETRQVINPLPYYATRDEVVADLLVREGMYVTPSMEIMALADLSTVWLVADVFAAQADWVAAGQPVEATLAYKPGEVLEGEVDFVSPVLDPKTRTVQARLKFDNPGEVLKPNMFANVTIFGGPKEDILVIPREALIRTGRESRVVLRQENGSFTTRVVVPGLESGEFVEIRAGLVAGQHVVTSGQFLIDSEASLNASLERLQGNGDSSHEDVPMPADEPEDRPGEER